jgi:hypothetical protein
LRKIDAALAMRVGPSRAALVLEVAITRPFLLRPCRTFCSGLRIATALRVRR